MRSDVNLQPCLWRCQVSWALVRFTPLAGLIPGRPEAMGLFIICLTVGATCIFLR